MKLNHQALLAIVLFLLLGVDAAGAKSLTARLKPNLIELTFKSRVINREKIDLGVPNASMGDMVLGNGEILDLNNKVIGSVEYQGIVTRTNQTTEQRWLQSEYSFGVGTDSILMEGAEEFETPSGLAVLNRPHIFSVTGGTGKYFGASGQCSVSRPDGLNFITKCQFSVLKQPHN
jgi:hypothetical protein